MTAVLPSDLPCTGQTQKGLVDERRRLQRVPLALPAHVATRQPAQLRFHERNELFERRIIAVAPRPQELGNRAV